MDLVDEQDDVAALVDLLQHLLQAFLEVTAVTGTRHQGPQVQGVQLLILQRLRHLAVDDVQCQALDHGGLTHAGFADQHWVVLGAAGQHLHYALDLVLATHDRVQLAILGCLSEVAAELVQNQGVGLLTGAARRTLRTAAHTGGSGLAATAFFLVPLVAAEQLDYLLAHAGQVCTELDQYLRRHAFTLADEAQQDVLGADVLVAQLQRFAQREFQYLLGTRGERDVAARRVATGADDVLDLGAHGIQGDAHGFQSLRCDTLALLDQAEQDVLGADVVVIQRACFLLRQHNDAARAIREPLEHGVLPFSKDVACVFANVAHLSRERGQLISPFTQHCVVVALFRRHLDLNYPHISSSTDILSRNLYAVRRQRTPPMNPFSPAPPQPVAS